MAVRKGHRSVLQSDMDDAVDRLTVGPKRVGIELGHQGQCRRATTEVGVAMTSHLLRRYENATVERCDRISIVPRGQVLVLLLNITYLSTISFNCPHHHHILLDNVNACIKDIICIFFTFGMYPCTYFQIKWLKSWLFYWIVRFLYCLTMFLTSCNLLSLTFRSNLYRHYHNLYSIDLMMNHICLNAGRSYCIAFRFSSFIDDNSDYLNCIIFFFKLN